MSFVAREWRVLLVLLVALLPRLWIVAQPIPLQLTKSLPDDAYYYFLTAQHIVAGEGPSVDGMNPSNGWHPLWMLVTTGVYALPYTDLDTPVRLIVGLGAVCDTLVAVALYLGARRFIGEAALVAGLVYAVNAMPILQAVNGLETGLGALCIALAWITTLAFSTQPTPRRAILVGIVYGLCFLARTDLALIVVWLGLVLLAALFRRPDRLRLAFTIAITGLIVILPWLLWNTANFGSPFDQSSAGAVPWTIRVRFEQSHPGEPLVNAALNSIPLQFLIRGDHLGAPIVSGYILWPLALFGLWRARRQPARRLALIAALLLLGGVTLEAVHIFARYYPRPWYFVVLAQSLSLGLALFWANTGPRVRLAAIASGVSVLILSGLLAWQTGLYPWQVQYHYSGAQWARENLPQDAVIGGMNSGIMGYYSNHRTVNLDGVVNPGAVAAIQRYDLLNFMQANGITHYIDIDYVLQREYGLFMGPENYRDAFEEIAVLAEPYHAFLGSLRAYRMNYAAVAE
jgi:hypothetical protein